MNRIQNYGITNYQMGFRGTSYKLLKRPSLVAIERFSNLVDKASKEIYQVSEKGLVKHNNRYSIKEALSYQEYDWQTRARVIRDDFNMGKINEEEAINRLELAKSLVKGSMRGIIDKPTI